MVTAVSTFLNTKAAHHGGSRTATARPPLLPSDSDNAAAPRRPKGRDVSSRYMSSPSPNSSPSSSGLERSASPLVSRTAASPAVLMPAAVKRSQSVQRKQLVTPRPNPLDLRASGGPNCRETAVQKVLFTSTRSLTVSFQGQSFSLQVCKTKPSPTPSSVRRGTPERRKLSVNCASTGAECVDRSSKSAGSAGNVVRALDDTLKLVSLNSNNSDLAKDTEFCSERIPALRSDLRSESATDSDNEGATGFSDHTPKLTKRTGVESPLSSPIGALNSRRYPSPAPRTVWPPSPSKLVTPAASTPMRNAVIMPSILCFAADVRSGRIGENRVADAHELRLLYNRLLQWRFVNARGDSSLRALEMDALMSLSSARIITSRLRNAVKAKRIELQSRRHNQKLASILHWQMVSLEAWDTMDGDYSNSLFGAVEALRASTLRLPVVSGARAEIQRVNDAVCSAADVMQALVSSTSLLSAKVEKANTLMHELVHATTKERTQLNQWRDLLSTIVAMQVKECSLMTHLAQLTTARPPSSFASRTRHT